MSEKDEVLNLDGVSGVLSGLWWWWWWWWWCCCCCDDTSYVVNDSCVSVVENIRYGVHASNLMMPRVYEVWYCWLKVVNRFGFCRYFLNSLRRYSRLVSKIC